MEKIHKSRSVFMWKSGLIALLLCFFLMPLSLAAGGDTVRIDLLTVNDFHGALLEDGKTPGGAKLASFIRGEQAKNPKGTLLLSAGDMFQGSVRSNILYGKPVVEMMDAVGFSAMALGNHEFDWGLDVLRARAKEAKFSFLSANISYKDSGKPVEFAAPYIIKEANGIKVGIIGITTPATAYTTNMSVAAQLSFADALDTVKKLLPELKKEGAQVVVVLGHIDSEIDGPEIKGEAAYLANGLKRIMPFRGHGPVKPSVYPPVAPGPLVDAIVTGHSHLKVAGKINGIAIVQAGYSGRALGKVTLFYSPLEKRVVESQVEVLDVVPAKLAPDAKVQKIINKSAKQAAPIEKTVLGQAETPLSHDRYKLSLLGEWVSDTIREATGADVAFQNGGGLRKPLDKGAVTLGHLYEILPFDNTIVTVGLTGRQILDVLEYGLYNDRIGMVQYSGLKVAYNKTRPTGERIVSVTMGDGSLLEPAKLYKVAVNDFMADGGDGYTMFRQGKDFTNTNIVLRDIVSDAVKKAQILRVEDDGRLQKDVPLANAS